MGFQDAAGYGLATTKVDRIIGAKAIGAYLLIVEIEMHFRARDDSKPKAAVHNFAATVNLEPNGHKGPPLELGPAIMQDAPHHIQLHKFDNDTRLYIRVFLSTAQLDEIESLRNSGDLPMRVQLKGLITDGSETTDIWEHLNYRITQSEWTEALRGMGYADRILLEVPKLSALNEKASVEALEILQEATQELHRGKHKNALVQCVRALEMAASAEAENHAATQQAKPTKKQNKDERLAALVSAVLAFAGAAKHGDEVAQEIKYNRQDVIAIIHMTYCILSMLSAKASR